MITPASPPPSARVAGDVKYVEGDALAHEFESASFDLITAVASLDHMPADRTLIHLRSLLRPGGVVVIGLARSSPGDWPLDIPDRSQPRAENAHALLAAPIAGPVAAAEGLRLNASDHRERPTRRPVPTPALRALHDRLGQALTTRSDPLPSRDVHLPLPTHAGDLDRRE